MISFLQASKQKILAVLLLVSVILFFNSWVPLPAPLNESLPAPQRALATYQFTPTGGAVVTGTALPILGMTVAAAEGTNLGSWRATIADDNFHFGINSTATGYNVHLDIGGVQLNNANKLFIQTEFDLDTTVPATLVQICDWVSAVGVHNVADAQCTTGGWRNLNVNDIAITIATPVTYSWAIYDGYWNYTAIARISTPLTNFVDGTNRIRIRYFSTTNTVSSVHIDFLRVLAVINPVYSPAGVTQISGGAPLGNYSMAIGTGVGGGAGAIQSGLDSVRFRVPGLAGVPSNFFFSFNNVRTYPGANTILVRAQYSCSATGISHRPSIWNFALSQWEDLTTASIACATANAIHAWARNNISIADYVSAGEVRIGWRGLANGTQEIQIDMIYMMIGSTNTSGTAEITFGTNAVGSVLATRDLDTLTATPNTWDVATVVESNTLGFPIYALDSDHDATAEQATSMNIDFPVTAPTNTFVTGAFFAGRFMAGAAGTVQMGLRDYGGSTILAGGGGGWTAIGPTVTTGFIYGDNITTGMAGVAGMNLNPKDHMDTVDNKMNIRLRTTLPTTAATRRWDFAMVSIQWAEVPVAPPPGETLTFTISDNTIGFGPLASGSARFATGDTLGNATEIEAHNLTASTNAGSGYVISVAGTTLTFGAHTITAIGGTSTASAPGTEQFGIRATATGGTGIVSAPYAAAGFALDAGAFPDEFASAPGATILTTFSVRYLANVSAMTEAGSYTANLTYTATGRF